MAAYRIARDARVIRTFQNARLFAGMSVLENLIVAQHADVVWKTANPLGALIGTSRYRRAMNKARENAHHWLERLGLLAAADETAGSLPYGSQRRLEIARAMCARPTLLCLDEPAAGLNPRESYELTELLLEIRRDSDVTMLLIEHDMSVVMRVADHVVVLDHGVSIAEGRARRGAFRSGGHPCLSRPEPGRRNTGGAMITVRNLHAGYGRIDVLRGIDLDVATSQIACVIGANGAGKTTLLMTICGHVPAASGTVHFEGEEITRLPTFEITRRGIAHVPEGRRIFPRMSVLENLQMGAFVSRPEYFASDLDFVLTLFPVLKERLTQFGGTLSGGEQQMLAIGRALMSRPRLLLLDEPSLGLAPLLVRQVFDMIRAINREKKTTILLIEQNAFQALLLATRAYVMVNGTIARQGTGAELLHDPAVRSAVSRRQRYRHPAHALSICAGLASLYAACMRALKISLLSAILSLRDHRGRSRYRHRRRGADERQQCRIRRAVPPRRAKGGGGSQCGRRRARPEAGARHRR